MWEYLPFIPEQASTIAAEMDALFFFLTGVSAFFAILIFLLVFFFAIRYRRQFDDETPRPIIGSVALEMIWTIVPLVLAMVMFVWGTSLYFKAYRSPGQGLEILVTGKQWMWKFQHPTGQREINELHIPLGRPVELTMASEDVIHSFYVPAFRVKRDVVPGTFSTLWFEATKAGEYHLFCAEYCGTKHSEMRGRIIVMEPLEYQNWLQGERGETPVAAGERLFREFGCTTCHRGEAQASQRGAPLIGIFGSEIVLENGQTVIADEGYLRESILQPQAKIVRGFQPIMPTYQGQMTEEELMQIIVYVRSLSQEPRGENQ